MAETAGAYSDTTNTHYDSWDDLVAAEANGYVAVAVLQKRGRGTRRMQTWTAVYGPFDTKREATNISVRIRSKFKYRSYRYDNVELVVVNVRPAWKFL